MKSDEVEKTALLLSDDDDDKIFDISKKKPAQTTPAVTSLPTTSAGDPKINRLQNQVKDVIDDMKINIEKVVERGQNLNDLNDRSEQLGAAGDMFSKRSRNLRKSMWLRTCRARMYLSITLSVIFLLIVFFLYRSFANE